MNPLQANKQINLLSSFINCSELSKVTDFLLDFLNFRNQNESEGIIAKALNTIDVKDPKLFIEETILFLNTIIKDIETNGNLLSTLTQFGIQPKFKLEDLVEGLKDIVMRFRNHKISHPLISFDWQVSVIERMKDNSTLNKSDTVEITTKFLTHDKCNVIKMKYSEFTEIFNNLKKIDSQLHMFKN